MATCFGIHDLLPKNPWGSPDNKYSLFYAPAPFCQYVRENPIFRRRIENYAQKSRSVALRRFVIRRSPWYCVLLDAVANMHTCCRRSLLLCKKCVTEQTTCFVTDDLFRNSGTCCKRGRCISYFTQLLHTCAQVTKDLYCARAAPSSSLCVARLARSCHPHL